MANVINSLKLGSGTYVFTTPYATCDTAAATAAKVATTTPGSNFSLETGARITVKFTVTNTAANPTLNVNSTGAKAIYYRGSAISAGYLAKDRTYEFVYNGTQYEFIGDIDTDTNTNTSHSHNAGVGLVGSGSASTSGGTYTYKAKLKDETKNANDSLARPSANANRLYPVEVDKSGYLAVTVPWSDTNTDTTTTTGATDTSSKIFLVGATSQSSAPTTYSHDTAYVGTDGCLYSNSKKVATLGDNNTFTGTNMFKGGAAQFRTSSEGLNDPKTDVGVYGILCQTGGNVGTYYKDGKITNGTSTLTLPSKSGTIALTSDLSNYVNTTDTQSVAGNKTFTGMTTFGNPITCQSGVVATNGTNTLDNAGLSYNSITRYTNNNGYTLTIPTKNGTLATTDDIPSTSSFATLSGNNIFTGITAFNNTVSCGTIISNSGFTAQNTSGTTNLASLRYDSIIRTTNNASYTLTIPAKDGTIATTDDIAAAITTALNTAV